MFLTFQKFEFFGKGAEKTGSNYSGGISTSGEFVASDYFSHLYKLGDFKVATARSGGYPYAYLDFGITEIYKTFFFVIGKILNY